MPMSFRALVLIQTLVLLTVSAVARSEDHPFPNSSPEAEGIDPQALEALILAAEDLLDEDAYVGAELHVIKNRKTVLHQGFGYSDRDLNQKMVVDSVFCVRSMTKPLVGTAIQLLLDEEDLTLETKVSEVLDSWDRPETRAITVAQLLAHRTGLPFTSITQPLATYKTLQRVAAEAARTPLLFKPGKGFQYSDAGSDTLGAMIAELTGAPVEEFLQERLIEPLEMNDTVTLLAHHPEVLARIPSAYSGRVGQWNRHWKSSDPPIFPLFLTSQSLYSTTTDYAKFLALWMDKGEDLLSPDAVSRGLTPQSPLPSPIGFSELEIYYGQQWCVYVSKENTESVALFGHSGSDGTWAWAWPELDLIILFFTQTRGTLSGVDMEKVIDQVLIQGDVEGYRKTRETRASAKSDWKAFEGTYWDETSDSAYYEVSLDEEHLSIRRPGAFTSRLKPGGDPSTLILAIDPSVILEFEPPSAGQSPAFLMTAGGKSERQVRHEEVTDLPDVEEFADGLLEAHGAEFFDELGMVHMKGKVEIRARGMVGTVDHWFDANRSFTETRFGDTVERVWITQDGHVYAQAMDGPVSELEGAMKAQSLLSHPVRRIDGWQEALSSMEILKLVSKNDQKAVVLRTGSGWTQIVDGSRGLLRARHGFEVMPGAGEIGVRVDYGDYREIEGVKVPFRIRSRYAHQLLGEIHTRFESAEMVEEPSSLEPPIDR